MGRGGPKTPEGKKKVALNGARHLFRRNGIRPCFAKCPFFEECRVKPGIGEPCPVEAEEFKNFAGDLLSSVPNPKDPVLRALAEHLAALWIRRRRGLEYLAGQPEDENPTMHYHLLLIERSLRRGLSLFYQLAKERGQRGPATPTLP